MREILDASAHRVRAACVVRWLAGPVNPLALAEYLKLSPDERAAGERLACQLRPQGDVEILLDHPAPPSQWMSLPPEDLMRVTSAPGGPAFEGVGIRHGMAAEIGAIQHVRATPAGYQLDVITGADIDLFQLAKAATAAAMAVLLADAGLAWADLERVCVCGAFGRRLDIANAQLLGLLPPIDPARIELFSDASLAGCERALLSAQGGVRFGAVASKIHPFNLSLETGFDDLFIDRLRLCPMPAEQA